MMKLIILILILIIFLLSTALIICNEIEHKNDVSIIVSDIVRLEEFNKLEEYNIQEGNVIESIDSDFLLVYINKSNIENGGNGVFAKKLIPKNSIICEYRGPIINNSDQSKLPYNDKYFGIEFAGEKYSILGESMCAIINDCSNAIEILKQNSTLLNENDNDPSECYENLNYNAVALAMGSKVFVVSSRDIVPNEELFFSYQWLYWKKQFLQKQLLNEHYMKPIIKVDK